MVVHVSPEGLASVKENIERLEGAEIHGESAHGKLVVVLESRNQTHITDTIGRINDFSQVLGTALVYHQVVPRETEGNKAS